MHKLSTEANSNTNSIPIMSKSSSANTEELELLKQRLEHDTTQRQSLLNEMQRHSQASSGVVQALVSANDAMGREMDVLKRRLGALEVQQGSQQGNSFVAVANNEGASATAPSAMAVGGSTIVRGGEDAASDVAVTRRPPPALRLPFTGSDDAVGGRGEAAAHGGEIFPPMRTVKFLGHGSPRNEVDQQQQRQQSNANSLMISQSDVDDDSSNDSDSTSSSEEPLAFEGWARVFFQARHHLSATQVVTSATTTTSQDTYLYVSMNSTSNMLFISNTTDRRKPPLIDPPISLKYFYALKVPGSHSGAALFLKNDSRRLRKYIFRFEFINRAVHQPPQRYIQFIRSGNAAKKSMRGMNKMKNALEQTWGGKEERKEHMKENKKRAQDAFAAHLGTLDELLRECDDLADRFVKCVNDKNAEVEEEEYNRSLSGSGGVGTAMRKRTRPPPPYWGSGFNRPNTLEEGEDVDSESDCSEEEDEMYYDDDNDDETFFDKVQVSTEQTLETLFRHIVK